MNKDVWPADTERSVDVGAGVRHDGTGQEGLRHRRLFRQSDVTRAGVHQLRSRPAR